MPVDAVFEERSEGHGTIALSGELDISTTEELRSLLTRAVLRSPDLTLDLANVTFLDCMVLGVLVHARLLAQRSGGRLHLVRCQPQVRRLLELTGLEKEFGRGAVRPIGQESRSTER